VVYPTGISKDLSHDPFHRLHHQAQPSRALPKAVAFPQGVRQVEIIKLGSSRLITLVGKRWDHYFRNGPRVSQDFMSGRIQPAPDERESF
jgi:antitoxin VapB